MKHILFLTWKDIKHPRKGGAEVVMYEYTKRLVSDGHKVTWFASSFDGAEAKENLDGINLIRKYNINTIYFFARRWYKQFKRNNKIDIIIDEAGGIPLLSPLYEKKIPIYFFIHHIGEKEYDEAFFFPINWLFKKFVFWSFSLYKKYPTITVSNSTKQDLEKLGFKDIHIIENATSLKPIDQIEFENKKNEIVFLGRLTSMKRVDETIKIFSEFVKNNPNYILNIIGKKQDLDYYNQLIQHLDMLGLTNKVNFIEYSTDNVDKYFRRAKVLLVTSKKEGFGLIVLEGNSYGLPVIAYNVPGLRDSIKESINGYLIQDEDYKAFSNKLNEIIDDKNIYKDISNSSLDYIKKLGGWDQRYKEFIKIIKL